MIKSLAQLYLDYNKAEADTLVNLMFDSTNPAAADYCRFTLHELAAKSAQLSGLMMKSESEYFRFRNALTLAEQQFIDRIARIGGLEQTTDKGKERLQRLTRDVATRVERTSRAVASFKDVYEKEKALEEQYKNLQQARQQFRAVNVGEAIEKRFN